MPLGVYGRKHFGLDVFLPKELESKVVIDVHSIACGYKHVVLVTKQGWKF